MELLKFGHDDCAIVPSMLLYNGIVSLRCYGIGYCHSIVYWVSLVIIELSIHTAVISTPRNLKTHFRLHIKYPQMLMACEREAPVGAMRILRSWVNNYAPRLGEPNVH